MIDLENLEPKYKICDEESEEDYELRICGYHDTDGLTWTDICNIINDQTGNDKTESTYRKGYKLYQKGFSVGNTFGKPIISSQVVNKIVEQRRRAERDAEEAIEEEVLDSLLDTTMEKYGQHYYSKQEKEELYDAVDRSSVRAPEARDLRKDARFSRFYTMIAENVSRLDPPRYIKSVELDHNEKEYVMTLADLHIGAKFSSVNNEYSIAEVRRRFSVLLERTKEFVIEKQITKLNILSLGDILQGMLRITDTKINEIPVVEAFTVAIRIISEFLNKLSEVCYIDFMQVCYSNHDQIRYLNSKPSEFAAEDFGKIMYAYLTDVLADNERVRILGDVEKDYYEFKVFDFNCIALHGHQSGDIQSLNKNLNNMHRKFYDYVFVGHSHSAKEFINAEGGPGYHFDAETLVAPSFIGSDPYADKLMVGSKAAVKIFEFDPVYGHTASYKFILN